MTPQDKRYDEYRVECAEINGYKAVSSMAIGGYGLELDGDCVASVWSNKPMRLMDFDAYLPTYLDDASIDSAVRKLDYDSEGYGDGALKEYAIELWKQCGRDDWKTYQATPEQKAEALCRTLIGEK